MKAVQVPDLWRAKADAERMYQLYLVRLQINKLHDRVLDACRQIRQHAARGPGRRAGLFTFSFEVDSLVSQRSYSAAWRQVQLRDEIIRGRRIPLESRRWSPKDFWELACTYAPLMYFLERYAVGAKLLETALSFWYRRRRAESYHVLFHVYNGDDEPRILPRVTLTHFYRHMGKDLKEWVLWPVFVRGLAAPLFRVAGIERKALLADSSQLATFFGHLMRLHSERVTSGATRGQADLIEDPAKVKRWQDARRRNRERFDNDSARDRTKAALYRHFPDLESLAR